MKIGETVLALATATGSDDDDCPLWHVHDNSAIPDSPALPKVARWLADHPQSVSTLRVIANAAARNHETPLHHIEKIGELLAALSEEA